jgi:predicted transcriptional regulator
MRTTITLDDDVAKLLSRARHQKKASLKEVINEALRQGLIAMHTPAVRRRPFETKSVDLGECLVGNVDDVAEALAVAEGEAFR